MHSPHAPTSLQALYRVFVLPPLTPSPSKRPALKSVFKRSIAHNQPRQPFSTTSSRLTKTRAPEQRHQKWDSEIRAKYIHLVDPTTQKLSEPRTRFDILNSFDSKTHRLVQLSPDEPHNPSFIPVCKIVSKKDTYELEKRRKAAAKEQKKVSVRGSDEGMKTLELNWAIAEGDLGHRLGKVRGFLEEGRRVEVVFMGKKGGRKASREECEGLVRRVRECVEGVDGARERRGLEGKIGGMASVIFQGSVPAGTVKAKVEAAVKEGD